MNKFALLILAIAFSFFAIYINQQSWNMVMPHFFGLPALTYLQTFIGGMTISMIVGTRTREEIMWDAFKKKEIGANGFDLELKMVVQSFISKSLMFGILWIFFKWAT